MSALQPLKYHYYNDDNERKKQNEAFIARIKWVIKNNCTQDFKIYDIGSIELKSWYNTAIDQLSFEKIYLWRNVSDEVLPSEIIFNIFNLTKNLEVPSYDQFHSSLSQAMQKEIVACDEGLAIAEGMSMMG